MRPSWTHPDSRMRRAMVVLLTAGVLVAACSGSTATSGPVSSVAGATVVPTGSAPTATPAATPLATPVPTKGPATQDLTITGPAGAAGPVTLAAIRCNLPLNGGLQISVLGRPADLNLSVYIFVQAGAVSVRYDSGAGATYAERDFSGTGVKDFDAAKGAQIDSPLTETTTKDAHGSLGVLTHISGHIDCGNQMPGSSTLAFSGLTTKGALSGGLNPVNVECTNGQDGPSVSIMGVVQVGSTPTDLIMAVSPGTFTVYPVLAGFYRNTSTAVASLSATGAHIEGDATEQVAPGSKATPHKVHVSGDVVCGTTVGG